MSNCPVCNTSRLFNARYPNYICDECIKQYKIKDIDDNELFFNNINIAGGIQASTLYTRLPHADSYECYINKKKCYATEARFGGIIIIAVNELLN